jgi:hypothetical protein
VNEVLAHSRKVARALADVRDTLHKVPYSYAHVERRVSLAGFVVKAVPPCEDSATSTTPPRPGWTPTTRCI